MPCDGSAHDDGRPCRGVQTIPPECFVCGVMDSVGNNVEFYKSRLPHWQCDRCMGRTWWIVSDDRKWAEVWRGDQLIAKFTDDDGADDYAEWKNATNLT